MIEPSIGPIGPDSDPDRLADLAGRAFGARARPWRATELAALLARPGVVALGDPALEQVLALLRIAASEAEVIDLGVVPERRGQGLGARLVAAVLAAARDADAEAVVLEVAEDNAPARALYARAGFAEAGRRPGYYARDGGRVDALTLTRAISSSRP